MTRVRDYFSDYQEEQMNFKITMGNKENCTPVGIGTIVFQTEARNRIRAINVLHVPDLGDELSLSVSASKLRLTSTLLEMDSTSNTPVGRRHKSG